MAANGRITRDSVLKLFESAREAKGTPYEPGRFQAFLTEGPQTHRRTTPRFHDFMRSVEREFGFCFSLAEWDRNFSLDQFVNLVEKKSSNPKQAQRYACKCQVDNNYHFGLQMFFTTAVFAGATASIPITAVRVLLVVIWAGLFGVFAYAWFTDYVHLKRIVRRTRERMA